MSAPEPGARVDDAEPYARALRTVLDGESERVAAALSHLHRAAVEAQSGAEAVLTDVFVDQVLVGAPDLGYA
ncbi:hypothetical protein M4D51_05445 [Microbacterium sp. p3-SID338]|uniref:hypothetical protein n=1 Tax=unclassified Microbacterium TaxID=2609290 RepID=UPI000C80429F|nr:MULTISPECIES: hypothetical protein [unclassified Microbacterium]MCT1395165.1 hypothetical protein [Microbacterium sp. p3-SID338]PMC02629.1 hypothetical protein CJ226_14650 [Microbacterium sp. UMB0228]